MEYNSAEQNLKFFRTVFKNVRGLLGGCRLVRRLVLDKICRNAGNLWIVDGLFLTTLFSELN